MSDLSGNFKDSKMKIGIVGYGIVGKAIENGFCDHNDVYICDPDPKYTNFALDIDTLAEKCEFIFVAVPTPMFSVGGEADTRIIDGVIEQLSRHKDTIVIVKSAVDIASVARYIKDYPDMHLVVSPEYLTDKNAVNDFLDEELLVLGGDREDTNKVEALFVEYSTCRRDRKVGHCDIMGAAIIKYMENSFLALKVTFMNQFYDLANAVGVQTDWHDLMEIFHYDSRMGNSHFDVPGPDGDRGWGGKCLPKDVNAVTHTARGYGVELDLIEKAWEINIRMRKNIDWTDIDGVVSDG